MSDSFESFTMDELPLDVVRSRIIPEYVEFQIGNIVRTVMTFRSGDDVIQVADDVEAMIHDVLQRIKKNGVDSTAQSFSNLARYASRPSKRID